MNNKTIGWYKQIRNVATKKINRSLNHKDYSFVPIDPRMKTDLFFQAVPLKPKKISYFLKASAPMPKYKLTIISDNPLIVNATCYRRATLDRKMRLHPNHELIIDSPMHDLGMADTEYAALAALGYDLNLEQLMIESGESLESARSLTRKRGTG